MNTARIVVLVIALGAGGVAAYLASGYDNKPAPALPVAEKLPTVEVLIAKNDIQLGQAVKPEDLQWQSWPAATASSAFIRRDSRPDAQTQIAGSIARVPLMQGEPIREQKLVQGRRLRLHGRDPAVRHAGRLHRDFSRDRRRRLHPAERPRRHRADAAPEESRTARPAATT